MAIIIASGLIGLVIGGCVTVRYYEKYAICKEVLEAKGTIKVTDKKTMDFEWVED